MRIAAHRRWRFFAPRSVCPLGSKINDKAVLSTVAFIVFDDSCEQAPKPSKTTKATLKSGFIINFVSLVGVDGFECRVVTFITARHHRRGSAVITMVRE